MLKSKIIIVRVLFPLLMILVTSPLSYSEVPTADATASVLAVHGKVTYGNGSAVPAFTPLPLDASLILDRDAKLSVIWENHQVELVGPAEGVLRELVAAASAKGTPRGGNDSGGFIDSDGLLVSAARTLSDLCFGNADRHRVAAVRGGAITGLPLPVSPSSGFLATSLLGPSLHVRIEPWLLPSQTRLVLAGPNTRTELKIEKQRATVEIPTRRLTGHSSELLAIGEDGTTTLLARWHDLPEDQQQTLVLALRQADAAATGEQYQRQALRAAMLSHLKCFYQAARELEALSNSSDTLRKLKDDSWHSWRPMVLDVEASWRLNPEAEMQPLLPGAELPSGATVRLQPRFNRPAVLMFFACSADTEWTHMTTTSTERLALAEKPWIEIRLDDNPAREQLILIARATKASADDLVPDIDAGAAQTFQLITPFHSVRAHGAGQATVLIQFDHGP